MSNVPTSCVRVRLNPEERVFHPPLTHHYGTGADIGHGPCTAGSDSSSAAVSCRRMLTITDASRPRITTIYSVMIRRNMIWKGRAGRRRVAFQLRDPLWGTGTGCALIYDFMETLTSGIRVHVFRSGFATSVLFPPPSINTLKHLRSESGSLVALPSFPQDSFFFFLSRTEQVCFFFFLHGWLLLSMKYPKRNWFNGSSSQSAHPFN